MLVYLLNCVFIYVFFLLMVHLATSLVNHNTAWKVRMCPPQQHKSFLICVLGAFVKLQKATISFVMSVCFSVPPSVRPSAWNNSALTGRILMKFRIWVFFEICEKISSFVRIWQEQRGLYMKTYLHLSSSSSSSSTTSSYICHAAGPHVDPFRSHVSRSLIKGLPWFLLPVGE